MPFIDPYNNCHNIEPQVLWLRLCLMGTGIMIENSVVVTLLVDDFDKAILFYVDQLGLFEVESDQNSGTDRQVSLRLLQHSPNFVLSLCKTTKNEELFQFLGNQCGDAIFMEFLINDAAEMLAKLQSFNIENNIHQELPYCEYMTVKDPFGNVLCLMEHFI